MVSVILPTYNSERTLGRAIESILSSGLKDVEVVVVDDGSKDNTSQICDRYCTEYSNVKCVHKSNGGVSSARNCGMEMSQGDFLMFCDADDEFSQRIETYTLVTDADLVVFGFDIIRESSIEAVRFGDARYSSKIAFDILMQHKMPGALWNKVFRRSLIKRENLEFRTDINFREDEEFLLRYLNACKTVQFSSRHHYLYYIPDLSIKYLSEDNFWCDVSMFESAELLLDDRKANPYLGILTNAYFSSFDQNLSNLYDRTVAYKSAVLDSDLSLLNISNITRGLLKMPSSICCLSFILKSFLYRMIRR